MVKSYLSQVISDVLSKHYRPLHQLVFVIPSQRAGVFLKQELVHQLQTEAFLPKIISIEHFIQEIAQITQVDTIQLLFEFYNIYIKHTDESERDTFDRFSQWAGVILQDFNEVDRHLVDSKDLFLYLRDINRLENWNPDTEMSRNYFSFFETLAIYYKEFYAFLLEKKQGYQGLIYREAASNIENYLEAHKDSTFVLVGFNALNKAEEKIFQSILSIDKHLIYWDADKSYLEDKSNNTGMFMRHYRSSWSTFQHREFNWVTDYLEKVDKHIEFIGATKNVGQLKYIAQLLAKQDQFHHTALILADESLLSLTLNSLPKKVDKINITMGYPLKDVPLASFIKQIFQLYLNQEKLGLTSNHTFYYKDILSLSNNLFFKRLIQQDGHSLVKEMAGSNLIFLEKNQILDLFSSINTTLLSRFDFLFEKSQMTVSKFIDNCIRILATLKDTVDGIEKEYVYRFYTVFQQLALFNATYTYITSIKTLYQLFTQLTDSEKLSFQGEPLEGLQLMGMLETRVIDFETVIITSVNEGVLPSSKSEQSFIPFDVKQHFGLPTYQEKDAIFSYHFYRLLHRAKNVYVLYNTESDVFGAGEKSRFLLQLELLRKDIKQKIVSPKVSIKVLNTPEVVKTSKVMTRLHELAQKGISPSALSTYINNPIDFYYQKVLGIKEVNEVEEIVANNTLGTIVHNTLEDLYKPFIGRFLSIDDVKGMFKFYEKEIDIQFKKVYKNGNLTSGKNKLIFEVSKKYIERFLRQELTLLEEGNTLKIIGLEDYLSVDIPINSIGTSVRIHGLVDRIDELNGITRIVDYKTGVVEESQLKIADFSKLSEDYKYTKALQVMMYAYMYQNTQKKSSSLEAGIISLKRLNKGFIKMNFVERGKPDYAITQERLDEFLIELKQIITAIFDDKLPFKENPNKTF